MSSTWTVCRQFSPRRDGDRRWDQASQLLGRWQAAQDNDTRVGVAVYARVSTTRQAQAQTIEQQLDRLVAAVTERGWTLDERHVYRDDGYSGAGVGPPGLGGPRGATGFALGWRGGG